LLREEEKEEETDYVAIPLRRDSFAPRDWVIPLFINNDVTYYITNSKTKVELEADPEVEALTFCWKRKRRTRKRRTRKRRTRKRLVWKWKRKR
jgi:hypothetical protein